MKRFILHADVDAFYASVEQRDNPDLRGHPIAVGGAPGSRGVIMTASYEARTFGVRSAMPSRQAIELCPELQIVPGRFPAYHEASKLIMKVFHETASGVEPLSLDEAFLDVSDRVTSWDAAVAHAQSIKDKVVQITRLTLSIGVAGSKLVAKIASDYQKPDGLTAVPDAEVAAFLAPLPIRKLWGVGPKTEALFQAAGINTVADLAAKDDQWLVQHVGAWSVQWRRLAQGIDDRVVSARDQTRQASREITFTQDTTDVALLKRTLSDMAVSLASSVESLGAARTIHIKLRYANFRTITRQRRLSTSITSTDDIRHHAHLLLEAVWDGKPVRLIGVGLSGFPVRNEAQLSLFDETL